MKYKKSKVFLLNGRKYFFTNIFDKIKTYSYGAKLYFDDKVEDNRTNWNRVAPGLYQKQK